MESSITVRELLKRGFYSMAFQPVWETTTNRILGFEALLRGPVGTPLDNPRRLFHQKGYLSKELLLRLDLACIGSAIRSGRLLAPHGLLFINAHGETIWHLTRRQHDLFQLFDQLEIAPDQVVFEVSESTEKAHARLIARSLRPFRERGIKIALDDIGVRHPWLHHILWLEPDFLKVDRAFVDGVDSSEKRQKLLVGLLKMTEHIGAQLIVEGVATEREWNCVRELGIPYAQGFWLGIPDVAEKWLTESSLLNTEQINPTPSIYQRVGSCEEVL
jgi:EAL domain-containing protein (putative c-di-GMP-specific phosphodiesterase class I)